MVDKRSTSVTLSRIQERFVEEFVVDLNATQAAIRAGYAEKGAGQSAAKLLALPKIQFEIAKLKRGRSERTEITADLVLQEIASLAFADIGDVVEECADGDVKLRDLKSIPPQVRRAIESIKFKPLPTGRYERQVKMHSKTTALKMLVDHLGLCAPVKLDVAVTEYEGRSTADLEEECLRLKTEKESSK